MSDEGRGTDVLPTVSAAIDQLWALYRAHPLIGFVASIGFFATCFMVGMIWGVGIQFINVVDKAKLFVEIGFYGTVAYVVLRSVALLIPISEFVWKFAVSTWRSYVRVFRLQRFRDSPFVRALPFAVLGLVLGVLLVLWIRNYELISAILQPYGAFLDGFVSLLTMISAVISMRALEGLYSRPADEVVDGRPAMAAFAYLALAASSLMGGYLWINLHTGQEGNVTLTLADERLAARILIPATEGVIVYLPDRPITYVPWEKIDLIEKR